jgi:hypothetical protein
MNEPNPERRIASELASSEKVLWSGTPRQGLMLRPADALMIPFSLLWGGFAVFWEYSVVKGGAPFFFTLWGIPFVAIGLYIIVGRFFTDSALRRRTYYAVTNERIIIVSGLFKETVKSLSLRNLSDMSLSTRPDGSGTITLGPTSIQSWFAGSGWPGAGQNAPQTLEGIPNVRMVHEIIRQAQRAAA